MDGTFMGQQVGGDTPKIKRVAHCTVSTRTGDDTLRRDRHMAHTLACAGEVQRNTGTKWLPCSRATVSCPGAVSRPRTQPEESEFNSITRTQKSPTANSAGAAALLEAEALGLCAKASTAALPAAVQCRKILCIAAAQCSVNKKFIG